MHLFQKDQRRANDRLQALTVDLGMGAVITHMVSQIHAVPRR
jgi:hypothetical protein